MLFEGAVALLRAGQGGSGGDLGCFLIQVFGKAGWKVEGGEGCRGLLVFFSPLSLRYFHTLVFLMVVVGLGGRELKRMEFF